jgi:hypothetical protein
MRRPDIRLSESQPFSRPSDLTLFSNQGLAMKLWKSLAVVASVALAGIQGACLTEAGAGAKNTAFIKGTSNSSAHLLNIRPDVVDGKNYRKLFKNEIEVPAGNRVVVLNIDAKFSLFDFSYTGRIPFRAELKPGQRYETRGKMSGRTIDIWIADKATNALASKVLSIQIEKCYMRFTCKEPRFQIRSEL